MYPPAPPRSPLNIISYDIWIFLCIRSRTARVVRTIVGRFFFFFSCFVYFFSFCESLQLYTLVYCCIMRRVVYVRTNIRCDSLHLYTPPSPVGNSTFSAHCRFFPVFRFRAYRANALVLYYTVFLNRHRGEECIRVLHCHELRRVCYFRCFY